MSFPVSPTPAADPPATNESVPVDRVNFEEFEGIGVPPRVAWLVSAILYGTAAILFGVLAIVGTVPASLGYVSIVGGFITTFCIIGAKLFPTVWWGGHLRSTIGMLLVALGAAMIGEVHTATSLVMVYPILVTAYLYDARHSLPYVFVGTAFFVVSYALLDVPTAHLIITSTVVGAISATIVASQHELRAIVSVNRELSTTDALTGLANVRRLRNEIAQSLAQNQVARAAVFAIDLDDFKQVNDLFSHTLGDSVLKAVADEVSTELEPADLLARRGGDEFAIFIADSDSRDLEGLRHCVAEAIARARTRVCPEVTPSGSVGYVIRRPDETATELLERADAELHEAKLAAHPERRSQQIVSLQHFRNRGQAKGRSDHLVQGGAERVSDDQEFARSIRRALGNASAWQVLAVLNLAGAVAILVALATTTGREVASGLPLVAAIGILLLGGFCVWASRRETGAAGLHAALCMMIALITLLELTVGNGLEAGFADLYLLPIVAGFYALDARRVWPYFIVGLSFYAATLAESSYAFALARTIVTSVLTLVMVGLLAKARRVTREFTEHAVQLSTVDGLTGLANIRGLRRKVADATHRCGETGLRLALIAIDLDDFKLVNDRHSHTLGDRVLVAVADAMTAVVARGDTVARRGGDEFEIVCILDDEADIPALVATLHEAISQAREALVTDVASTASIGYVAWKRGESSDAFLARADQQLHGAKVASHALRDRTDRRRA
jgi:diguanylate cyclase (GGDEF)-like protein